jgi:hypothetical protein
MCFPVSTGRAEADALGSSLSHSSVSRDAAAAPSEPAGASTPGHNKGAVGQPALKPCPDYRFKVSRYERHDIHALRIQNSQKAV